MTKSGASARSSAATDSNAGGPQRAVISAPRSAERLTTPVARRRSGAARARRRKNSERQPVPMMPKVVAVID